MSAEKPLTDFFLKPLACQSFGRRLPTRVKQHIVRLKPPRCAEPAYVIFCPEICCGQVEILAIWHSDPDHGTTWAAMAPRCTDIQLNFRHGVMAELGRTLQPGHQNTFRKNKAARATMASELNLMQCREIVSHVERGPVPATWLVPALIVPARNGAAAPTWCFGRHCACWNGSKMMGPTEASPRGSTCQTFRDAQDGMIQSERGRDTFCRIPTRRGQVPL